MVVVKRVKFKKKYEQGISGVERTAKNHRHITFFLFLKYFFIIRRIGKTKAYANHTSTSFHTRRASV